VLTWVLGNAALLLWAPESLAPYLWWPILTGLAGVALALLLSRMGRRPAQPQRKSQILPLAASSAVLAALALLQGSRGIAVEGPPYTVYILGTPAISPDEQMVLAPVELLKRLDQITQRAASSLPGAVLVHAGYDGVVVGDFADFKADLQVYCFADQVDLLLPFQGIQLREGTLVEGAPAFPLPASGAREGYVVTITGAKGRFVKIHLPFRVRTRTQEGLREVRCTIPRLPESQLNLVLPREAEAVYAVSALGRQQVQPQGTKLLLQADLGLADPSGLTESTLYARWQQAPAVHKPVQIEVEEFHDWNLQPARYGLTSVFRFTVRAGAASTLQFRLPPGLEYRSVELSQPAQLKDVRVVTRGADRLLEVVLAGPVRQDFQMTVDWVLPASVSNRRDRLLLPTPLRARLGQGMLGAQLPAEDLVEKAQHLRFNRILPEIFTNQWQLLRRGEPVERISRAYRFSRTSAAEFAGIEITLPPSAWEVRQKLRWLVSPTFADVQGQLTVGATNGQMMMLEWEVPGALTVAGVSAPDLLYSDVVVAGGQKRIQLWFSKPQTNTQVELRGWLRASPQASAGRPWASGAGAARGQFVVPHLQPLLAVPCPTEIEVVAARGLALQPGPVERARIVSGPGELTFAADRADYAATVFVQRTSVPPEAMAVLVASQEERGLDFTAVVHYQASLDDLRTLTVQLDRWTGGPLHLDAPQAVKVKAKRSRSSYHWQVQLPPGISHRYTLRLTGKFAGADAAGWKLPDLKLPGADLAAHWVVLEGPGLQIQAQRGLQKQEAVGKSAHARKQFLDGLVLSRASSVRQFWKIGAADWTCRVVLTPTDPRPAVQVLWAEQGATPVANGRWLDSSSHLSSESQRWLHNSSYLLAFGRAASVTVDLPPGAALMAASLDDRPVILTPARNGGHEIFLPEGPPIRRLSLRWFFPAPGEPFYQPNLTAPHLHGLNDYPVLWTVQVPFLWQSTSLSARTGPRLCPSAEANVFRAEALLRCTETLTRQWRDSPSAAMERALTEVQQALFWFELRAAVQLDVSQDTQERRELGERLTRLRAACQELPRQLRLSGPQRAQFNKIHASARQHPALTAPWNNQGPEPAALARLFRWYGPVSAEAPSPGGRGQNDTTERSNVLVFLVLLLVAGWVLCGVPIVAAVLRWTWPELLALLTLTAWLTLGASLIGAALLVAALFSRLILLLAQLQHRAARRPAPSAAGTGSNLRAGGMT
jgi:hypothetical protein